MAEVSMCYNNSSELSPDEERIMIKDIALSSQANTKEGDTFFIITQRWWHHWIEYVNQDQTNPSYDGSSFHEHSDLASSSSLKRPSGIDNYDLIDNTGPEDSSTGIEIHDTLLEGRDYVLLPQEVWNQLFKWYGGGPTLERKVITSGLSQTEFAVEVYPLRLQLLVLPRNVRSTIRISKKETIGQLHKKACEIFDLLLDQVRIWDYYGHRKHALMNDMDKTLDDVNLQMDQDILVEVVNNTSSAQENGSAHRDTNSVLVEPTKSSVSNASGLSTSKGASRGNNIEHYSSQRLNSPVRDSENPYGTLGVTTRGSFGGLTGLLNLGNTCFMNSAIQCLVHTPEFARYFREDYHQEINWQNPLGMVGELALAFGELLRKLWAPGRTPIAPRPFKAKLARFAPQFSGHNQHDSQELLAFLLDGLHEDLNRVKHKPYIKSRDADGRPDEEVADEYWANHIARNDSIIVDVCQGQYKSTLVCPVCNKVSVTFDPFMYLSLPLQSTTNRTMTVTVFSCDSTTLPSPCTVTVPKQGRCRDLIQALSNACSLKHNERMVLVEIRNHLIHRFFEDPLQLLSSIKDDDRLAAYKITKMDKNTKYLQLIHRRREQSSDSHTISGWKPYGTPIVSLISCDDTITRGDIQVIVNRVLSPLLLKGGNAQQAASAETNVVSNSINKDDTVSKATHVPTLPLLLVDDNNACIDLSMGEEKVVKLSPSSARVLVYIDWSQKLLEKYDTYPLETLPEVLKYGPVTKKARTEPLSLYTCLEAFLREEPLVPEDMWYCPKCKERRQASKKLDLWRLPFFLFGQERMERTFVCCLVFLCFLIPLTVADWNILNQKTHNGLKISLKNYCESWRMNVELHNIRDFQVVPEECTEYITKYVKSTQYKVDSERTTEECLVYLSTSCNLKKDGKDAWIFDIDDTLLSTIPFYKNNLGKKINVTALEEWMSKGKAPALDYSVRLFNEIKSRGIKIILISGRREYLRSATIDNLVNVGYHGWTGLILRDPTNELVSVAEYKSQVRKYLTSKGYRIWGVLGDQFSSIAGNPSGIRAFKFPNPMYYVA